MYNIDVLCKGMRQKFTNTQKFGKFREFSNYFQLLVHWFPKLLQKIFGMASPQGYILSISVWFGQNLKKTEPQRN